MNIRSCFLGLSLLVGAAGCASLESTEATGSAAQPCKASNGDALVTHDLMVKVSSGATLHVVEKYDPHAVAHGKRRAMLMLPATLVTNLIWNADVPDHPEYNALEQTAREGFYSYTLDYEGYGTSSGPANGKDVTAELLLQDTADLVEWIRHRSHASKVDLMGASLGSSLAVALGGAQSPIPRHHVGHIVLTAAVYKSVSPFASQFLLSPALEAMLESVPTGYIDTTPDVYGVILIGADAAAANYCFANCPGRYSVGPTLSGFHLPAFEGSVGRAPMLQFWGDHDMITPLADAELLQAEYGGPHALVVLNGGAHAPHWESVRTQFWDDTFAFLSTDTDDD